MFVALSPTIFPFAFILPETVTALRVPTDVIFGCAAVCNVPVRLVKVAPTPEIFPEKVVAVAIPVTTTPFLNVEIPTTDKPAPT